MAQHLLPTERYFVAMLVSLLVVKEVSAEEERLQNCPLVNMLESTN